MGEHRPQRPEDVADGGWPELVDQEAAHAGDVGRGGRLELGEAFRSQDGGDAAAVTGEAGTRLFDAIAVLQGEPALFELKRGRTTPLALGALQ